MTTEFWYKGQMLQRLRVAFHPNFQLADTVEIAGIEYYVIHIQWVLKAAKAESTLGADASLSQRVQLAQRDRYGVRDAA